MSASATAPADMGFFAAQTLVSQLGSVGVEAHVTGAGVHWQVRVEATGSRSLLIHCLWYERAITGLVIGLNPANARSRLRETRSPYEGPEYLVILKQHGVRVADGRARDAAEVVACASAWLAHGDLELLAREVPFIGEKDRAMRALAGQLDPTLRWEIGDEPSYELWVYGGDRSCRLVTVDGAISCRFFMGQAQVAHGTDLDDVPAAVAAWISTRVPVRLLAAHAPAVQLEPHAEVLETDPPRWHWLHVRDRIADPSDVLAPLRDLIEALAASPVATTFYSYSSLNRFCFSASSHYPWIDHGLPVVAPAGDGAYAVGEKVCDVDGAVRLIESQLAAFPIRPFFGSAPHHELPLLAECLAARGSALVPQLELQGAFYRLVVRNAPQSRRCEVSDCHVTFLDEAERLDASWSTLEDAVAAIARFCEEGAPLNEIAADPRVQAR